MRLFSSGYSVEEHARFRERAQELAKQDQRKLEVAMRLEAMKLAAKLAAAGQIREGYVSLCEAADIISQWLAKEPTQ